MTLTLKNPASVMTVSVQFTPLETVGTMAKWSESNNDVDAKRCEGTNRQPVRSPVSPLGGR